MQEDYDHSTILKMPNKVLVWRIHSKEISDGLPRDNGNFHGGVLNSASQLLLLCMSLLLRTLTLLIVYKHQYFNRSNHTLPDKSYFSEVGITSFCLIAFLMIRLQRDKIEELSNGKYSKVCLVFKICSFMLSLDILDEYDYAFADWWRENLD